MTQTSTDIQQYPPGRGKPGQGIYALKFIRLLGRAHVAAEVTGLGELLLVKIVMKEDSFGYSKAPTFWDSQLQEELGDINQKTLAAVRRKCVAAGWLHYEHGRKGKAGRYFTTIPPWATELLRKDLSGTFDVNLTENTDQECDVKITENDGSEPDSTENLRRIGNETGTKEERNGNENGSILTSSFSSSSSKELHTLHREGQGTFLTGPSAAFRTFQERYPRKTSPTKSWEAWQSVVVALVGERGWTDQQAEEFLIERAAAFANSPLGQNPPPGQSDDFRPAPAKWLADGRYDEPDSEWQKPNFRAVAGNASGRRRTPASEALRSSHGATDYDAMFDAIAAAKHPADPEANAKNASVREQREQSAVESLEQRLGAELDQIPDVDLPALCAASKDRSIDEAARDARSKLAPYGRDDPRTRAALLKLLDVRQRREPAIVS